MNWKKPTHGHLEQKREPLESSPVIESIERKNRRKRWNKTFTVLAGVVVFAMTYSLILPAFTIEEDEAEEMPGLEYEMAYELAKDGDLLQIVPDEGAEARIAVVVDTVSETGNSASVIVLENDPVAGVQITEMALDDPAVSVLTPEEAVQVEGLEEEVLYLVQAAEEEGILEPEEREALEGDVQESLEELGVVVDSSAAPQNDNEEQVPAEDSSAVPQNDNEEQVPAEDSSAAPEKDNEEQAPQKDNEEQAPAEDASAAPQNDIEVQAPQNDNEVPVPAEDSSAVLQNDSVVMTGAFDCIGEALDSILLTESLQETLDGMTITARYAEGVLPEGVRMKAVEVDPAEYTELVAETTGKSDAELKTFDITFLSGDREVQPNGEVKITFQADFINQRNKLDVVHIADDGTAEVVESKVRNDEVSLKTDSFSVYAISYTVDFHWDVDGEEFEFKLAGGTGISLRDLLTAQNVIKDNPETARDEVREFLDNIENVTFSNPDLAWVGTVRYDNTISSIKEYYQMECEYSADLTEEEIAEMNSRAVLAGEWAFVSKAPFTSEETLTITMKNGEVFTIRVTDAQISTRVITSKGEDFTITVQFGPEAEIPDNAVLEASEIDAKSKEFEKYVDQTMEALNDRADLNEQEEEDGGIVDCTASGSSDLSFARFFDIRIMAGEEKIEPKAPVTVKIAYSDAIDVEEGEELLAVHFAEEGTEIIPIQTDQKSGELTFTQDSFSVTGTVVTVGNNAWPNNNGSYVLFTQIGEQYYAINHDGELIPVTRNGNNLSFEDADVLFHGMDEYLWTYQSQTNPFGTTRTLFYNVGETQYWLNPADEDGVGNNRALDRTNSRIKVSNGEFYLTADADHSYIVGQGNADDAIPVYFAQNFNNQNKVIVHFVDRNGNPIQGVTYNGSNSNVISNPSGDGTFAIPYNWNGATGVVDLSADFSKTGYTYASTHLSGVQGNTTLRQDGLTIDAKLTERQNGNLYIGTDIGSNNDYYAYTGDATTNANDNNQSGQRSLNGTIRAAYTNGAREDYATTTDKDIYVILDPAPNTMSGGEDDPIDVDADDPEFAKTLEDNGDGTYTLSLTIEGHANSVHKSTNANVLFVVDTSSSMHHEVGRSTRIEVTHDALKKLGDDLMSYNNAIPGRVEVSMITFDGSVSDALDWTDSKSDFDTAVERNIVRSNLHRGTDWEDALKAALAQAKTADSDPTFVVFFTDGEPSQYSNYHGAATFETDVPNSYYFYFNSFLSRESSKDEARALVDSGYELYGVFAFNNSGHTYPNGATGDESDSDLLHNLLKYGYNTDQDLGENSSNERFFPSSNQDDLERAFDKILESINISVGFDEVVVNDAMTEMTQAGFATSFDSVNDFTYYRSGKGHGTVEEPWEAWEDAPQATPIVEGDNVSVQWKLENDDGSPMFLEDGVKYRLSFIVWPKQEDFDWVANLQNGTKTWQDVVDAGLDFPNGANPQIVNNGNGTYSIATNKPSTNDQGQIINNGISYKKVRTELLKTLPEGEQLDHPVTTYDEDGNEIVTTYTSNNGVITKTVVTEKSTYFKPPEPMGLNETKMKVKKEWADSINLGHRAKSVIFKLLVDGQPYMDKTDPGEDPKEYELPVGETNNWINEIVIAPGVIRDGDVLEPGHSYKISEEYEVSDPGTDYYAFSFEFKSQTVRPMNIDGELVYLVEIDDDNPAPSGAAIHAIDGTVYYAIAREIGKRYYEAETDATGEAYISGTNGKTSELDITKIIDKGNTNLTDNDLDSESFTYRITLDIPAGSNIDGIMGYCYIEYPNGPNPPFKLYGYQPGETALASDIARFGSEDDSKKIYRSWNTTNNVIKNNLMTRNEDGSITIKMDLTLTQKEVLRLTNLPSGTEYEIEEVYANYYGAPSPTKSEEGKPPVDAPSNLAAQGYSVTQVLTKDSNQTEDEKVTHTGTTKVSGTISKTDTRYYNQFTNELTNTTFGELKVTKHLDGYEWNGERYYFNLAAGTATYSDDESPATGVSPMPGSNRIYLSNASGTDDKTYTFGKIRYSRPGTYQYTITETDAAGNVLSGTIANNIAYAPADTVTVTVDYDDDGHLVVQKIEGFNGHTSWSTSESSAVVTGTTTFTNSYVVSVPIKKMDVDQQTPLSGAEFELISGNSKLYFDSSYNILTATEVEAIIGMSINDNGAAAAMARNGIASTFTIGEISLKGLSLNTAYTLKEINPPAGYIIAENDVTFVLSKEGDAIKTTVTGGSAYVDENNNITLIITNTPGAALPSTGGPGTEAYLALGALMAFGAGAVLIRRKLKRL